MSRAAHGRHGVGGRAEGRSVRGGGHSGRSERNSRSPLPQAALAEARSPLLHLLISLLRPNADLPHELADTVAGPASEGLAPAVDDEWQPRSQLQSGAAAPVPVAMVMRQRQRFSEEQGGGEDTERAAACLSCSLPLAACLHAPPALSLSAPPPFTRGAPACSCRHTFTPADQP
eukprot:1619818-Pyramimonas_sp.AAC.1